jgi:hypothetical protein
VELDEYLLLLLFAVLPVLAFIGGFALFTLLSAYLEIG